MPKMPKPDAEALLGPHGPTLVECVRGSVADYFSEYPASVRVIHSRRTRANIIRDHMIHRAQIAFANVGGVNLVRYATKGRYTLLSVEGRALLRFKYLGTNKRSRNVKTQLAKAFTNNQVAIAQLPPEATRFDVGYTWNMLQTTAHEVSISCPTPTGVEYVIDLWIDTQPETLSITEGVPVDPGSKTQVVAKDASIDAVKDADGGA
jgi:hypothetical protein